MLSPHEVLQAAWPVAWEWMSVVVLFWLVGWAGWHLGRRVGLRVSGVDDGPAGPEVSRRVDRQADRPPAAVATEPPAAAPADDGWLNLLPEAAVLLNDQYNVVGLNPEAVRLISHGDPAHLRSALAPLLTMGTPRVQGEVTLDGGGGVILMLEVSARRFERPTDHGVPTPQWLVLLREISEEVHQRQVAESHRQRLLQTLDATGMAAWEWDVERQRLYTSPRAWRLTYGERALTGAMPTVLTLDDVWAAVHPEDLPRVQQLLLEGLKHHDTFDYRCRTVGHTTLDSGGSAVRMPVWAHTWAQVQRDARGRAVTVRGLMRDVTTEQRQTDLMVRSRQELQRLSASLLQAREDERKHIARELHDELGQRMSLLKMRLSGLVNDVAQASVLQAMVDPLEEVVDETDELIRALRRIASDLRPPMIDDLGLVEAIRWLANESGERLNLTVCTDLEDPGELPLHTAMAVFRMVQEALNIAHRHAQAQTLVVALRVEGGGLVVTARDDGVGYGPAPAGLDAAHGDLSSPTTQSNGTGWGLIGIRERAALLGGHFEIRRASAGGTELRLWLPRPPTPAADAAQTPSLTPTAS